MAIGLVGLTGALLLEDGCEPDPASETPIMNAPAVMNVPATPLGAPVPAVATSGPAAPTAAPTAAAPIAMPTSVAPPVSVDQVDQPAPAAFGQPSSRAEASGRLLLPRRGLALVTLPSGDVAQIVDAGDTGLVTGGRWSPDGTSAAYAGYYARPGESNQRFEILVRDLAGETRVVAEGDAVGAIFEAPAWSPDGHSIYFAYSVLEDDRLVQRIQAVDARSGARAVVADGRSPDVSPDGLTLAFLRAEPGGDTLLVAGIDGQQPRVLIPPRRFAGLADPRFSPDGRTLAVAASSRPDEAGGPTRLGPFALLGARAALAHGFPWDVYVIDVGGGDPRRLTHLAADEISIAWSPDGARLALYGPDGLRVVGLDGQETSTIGRGGYGGIDWSR